MFVVKKFSAFTLIEMTMVLWIIGLLFYGSFEASKYFIDQNNIRATIVKLNTIQSALDMYLLRNGKLPCPAGLKLSTGAVMSSCSSTNTTSGLTYYTSGVARGGVPYDELGLSLDMSYDAWRSKIIYTVVVPVTTDFKKTTNSSYNGIYVYNYITSSSLITNRGVYALVSNGKNRLGAFSYDTNSKLSSTGISVAEVYNVGDYSNADTVMYFPNQTKANDDLTVYKTRAQMIHDLNYDDIGCYATAAIITSTITAAGITTGNPTFATPSTSYLEYNEELTSTNSHKYKLKCFKNGRLGIYKYE